MKKKISLSRLNAARIVAQKNGLTLVEPKRSEWAYIVDKNGRKKLAVGSHFIGTFKEFDSSSSESLKKQIIDAEHMPLFFQ